MKDREEVIRRAQNADRMIRESMWGKCSKTRMTKLARSLKNLQAQVGRAVLTGEDEVIELDNLCSRLFDNNLIAK